MTILYTDPTVKDVADKNDNVRPVPVKRAKVELYQTFEGAHVNVSSAPVRLTHCPFANL